MSSSRGPLSAARRRLRNVYGAQVEILAAFTYFNVSNLRVRPRKAKCRSAFGARCRTRKEMYDRYKGFNATENGTLRGLSIQRNSLRRCNFGRKSVLEFQACAAFATITKRTANGGGSRQA